MARQTKCPQCDGFMEFNPVNGKLKCPFCDFEQAIQREKREDKSASSDNNDNKNNHKNKKNTTKAGSLEQDFLSIDEEDLANSDWGTETVSVVCDSCTAEVIFQANMDQMACPYCGAPTKSVPPGTKRGLAPNGVIPFRLDAKKAEELFKNWLNDKFYCDGTAKRTVRANKMQGLYVPYWTFDSNVQCDYTGEYGIDRRVRTRDGKTRVETDWYSTRGYIEHNFDDVLIPGTRTQNLQLMSGIEPFEGTNHPEPYQPEFMTGFTAERYSVGPHDAWDQAKKKMEHQLNEKIKSDIIRKCNADKSRVHHMDAEYFDITYKYLLVPVWISSFKFNDKIYNFMINGQTGKVYGNYPLSVIKVTLTIIAFIILAILFLYFFGDGNIQ